MAAKKKTDVTILPDVPTTPLPKIELGYGPPSPGRPRTFKDVATITTVGQAYINQRRQSGQALLMTGLAIALGTCRETLLQYGHGVYDDVERGIIFSDAVKNLVQQVIADWEDRMAGRFPTGAIFWLKNHGWADNLALTGADNGPIEVRFVSSKGK